MPCCALPALVPLLCLRCAGPLGKYPVVQAEEVQQAEEVELVIMSQIMLMIMMIMANYGIELRNMKAI